MPGRRLDRSRSASQTAAERRRLSSAVCIRSAASRSVTSTSAAALLRLLPVIATRNASRSRAIVRSGSPATTVAVRGMPRSDAISPKQSPGPSGGRGFPARWPQRTRRRPSGTAHQSPPHAPQRCPRGTHAVGDRWQGVRSRPGAAARTWPAAGAVLPPGADRASSVNRPTSSIAFPTPTTMRVIGSLARTVAPDLPACDYAGGTRVIPAPPSRKPAARLRLIPAKGRVRRLRTLR